MCGICGIIFDDPARHVDPQILKRMNDTLRLRGPDDEGFFLEGQAGLAIRRLSIIDVAGGHQPMTDEKNKITSVVNGEIYNYLELKKMLGEKGHVFRSRSDAEVGPHLYEEFGADFPKKLQGMFGLALWDSLKSRLLLARDRMGKKPLYWTHQNGVFLFGSELKAILAFPGISRHIDTSALAKYLAYEYVPSPHSIFFNIHKLEAGHLLILEKGKVKIQQYWDIPTDEEYSHLSEAEAVEEFRRLFFKAVERRLMSDVGLGVFLSGGIDSSGVTAAMAKIVEPKTIRTFSIAFEEKSFDESSYARQVAKHLGTSHQEEWCTPQTLLDLSKDIAAFLDEPLGDASIFPTYALSKFTRRHVTVALGGDGGDELFAGYPTFQAENYARWYRQIPVWLREKIVEPGIRALPVSDKNISLDFRLKQFVRGAPTNDLSRHFLWIGSFSGPELQELLINPPQDDVFGDLERYLKASQRASPGNQLLYVYKKLYLQEDILAKVDRASMAASLECRSPFLDQEVVEFVARLPYALKLKGNTMKYLLKKAFAKELPQNILHRPKKGFGIPVAKWLKGPLRETVSQAFEPARLKVQGIFHSVPIQRLWQEHLSGHADHRKKLWTLFVFQRWWDRWAG